MNKLVLIFVTALMLSSTHTFAEATQTRARLSLQHV